jgi:hypothetical protein
MISIVTAFNESCEGLLCATNTQVAFDDINHSKGGTDGVSIGTLTFTIQDAHWSYYDQKSALLELVAMAFQSTANTTTCADVTYSQGCGGGVKRRGLFGRALDGLCGAIARLEIVHARSKMTAIKKTSGKAS